MARAFGCKKNLEKTGILITQLGTPAAPTPQALRRYLKQFLSDPRVVEMNRLAWWLILNGIILNTRPKRSAALYRRIWREDGVSPLRHFTERQVALVAEGFAKEGIDAEVTCGMRYGNPSIEAAVDELIERGCSRIILFPMYPQYSAATTGSTYDAFYAHLLKKRWVPSVKVVDAYYRHPAYVEALATSIRESCAKLPVPPEYLILSYHGIPQRYVRAGDPYCCMCTETSAALRPLLGGLADHTLHTYQSRFGREPWLSPYTDETITMLGQNGVRRLAIACPGFPTDCLETLDEIGNEGAHAFQAAGGEQFTLVPCLNDHPAWIEAMLTILKEEGGGWLGPRHVPLDEQRCSECPVEWKI